MIDGSRQTPDLVADAAAVRQLLLYFDHLGLDERALGVTGLDAALRTSTSPLPISGRWIVTLLDAAARLTQQPDFALRFVAWLNPRSFGPISVIGGHCRTYADQFDLFRRYGHLENNTIGYEAAAEGPDIALVTVLRPELRPIGQQFVEGVLALQVRLAQGMLGPDWRPERVEFAYPAPESAAAQRRFFQCAVEYGADRHALTMQAADYRRRLPHGDDETLEFLETYLARASAQWPADLPGQVALMIGSQLAGGSVSVNRVAALLNQSPRTLQRRLAAAGTDFGSILAYVRMQIVREQMDRPSPPPLAHLAHLLGFSEPSAACRFVRAQTGAAPGALRRPAAPAVGAP